MENIHLISWLKAIGIVLLVIAISGYGASRLFSFDPITKDDEVNP